MLGLSERRTIGTGNKHEALGMERIRTPGVWWSVSEHMGGHTCGWSGTVGAGAAGGARLTM
eukprot:2336945-Rhodomonas_salina.2